MKLHHKFYLSLAIFVGALVFALPNQYKTIFEEGQPLGFLSFIAAPDINLGLDLQGGTQLEFQIDLSRVAAADEQTVIDGIMNVIRRRIDNLGVTEPNVYTSEVAGNRHIYVELAGVRDIEQAKNTVGRTIQLEFREQREGSTEEEKQRMRDKAELVREEIGGEAERFATVAQEAQDGDQIQFSEKESYTEQVPEFLAPRLAELESGMLLNEVLEGNEGFVFQSSTNAIVPYEGFFLVRLVDKVRELRVDPRNAEDFLVVAQEVSGDNAVEVGFLRSTDAVTYSTAAALPSGHVSDVIEGADAFYIVKSLRALAEEEELRDVEILTLSKQPVNQLERQIADAEVTRLTNEKAQETAVDTLATITPNNFRERAMAVATEFPSFVIYSDTIETITLDSFTTPMEVVNAAFSVNSEQVISEVVRTNSSLEIIYVTNVGMLEGENPMREVYRLIFVQSQVPTEAEVNAARERNAELASMANGMSSAEDFSAMAQELAGANEEVSYTDRGYVNKEALNDMGETLFATTPGSITEVVETETAYYVARMRGIKPAGEAWTEAQVATICFTEACGTPRDMEEARVLADATLQRMRMEDKYVYEQLFFSAFPDEWQPAMLDGKVLTGEFFQRAEVGYAPVGPRQDVVVNVTFDAEGARMFEEITARNIGKPLAIFVGDELISAPMIRERIGGGQAQISGGFTVREATDLARDLNTGALPAPISLVGQQTIGATLGATALSLSINAALAGVAILFLYMLVVYRFNGLVAIVALVVYMVIMLALIKIFGVTLTLAGIAALILSMGLAVDGNVLIFERLKEEMTSTRDMRSMINTAFDRAWSSIWDGNVSSLITAMILYWSGTSVMKGFAFMLVIGTIVSMFSAVYVSRVLLLMLARTSWGKKLIGM